MSKSQKEFLKPKFSELEFEMEKFGGVALYTHPFYDWVDENINKIENKLLYAIMSNIVPLGDNGRKYFMHIAMKRKDSFIELMNLYASIEKLFNNSFVSISTYSELCSFGYKGHVIGDCCPAYDVLKLGL